MVSTSFDESTECLGRPKDMTDDQCDPLSVWRGPHPEGYPVVVSCWKLTKDELHEFNKTGRIWLMIVGDSMPPVSLNAISPFKPEIE